MTPLATRIMEIINRRPATGMHMVHILGADPYKVGRELELMRAAGQIERFDDNGTYVYRLPPPKTSKPRPRTPRAPRVKKSKLHPGILELMKRQGKV